MKDLLEAADLMRRHAATAANNQPDDILCCWETERLGGQERVIGMRRYPEGTDHQLVALPAEPGIAEHIAGWHPDTALAVADLIEAIGARSGVDATLAAHARRIAMEYRRFAEHPDTIEPKE